MREAGGGEGNFSSASSIRHPFFATFSSTAMPSREVVITGIGVVSPIGVGRDAVWDSIANSRSGVRAIPALAEIGWPAPFGGEVVDFEPKELVQPRKSLKVMSPEIQFASAAAELAWQDAGLGSATIHADRFGVLGAAGLLYCELEELHAPFVAWMKQADFDIHRWSKLAMGELYPLWLLKYLPNMPACHIGIRYDARGPNNTISQGDVSSLLAIAEAADVIRRDQADLVIVGGTGSRLNLTDLMWHRAAGLAMNGDIPPAAVCRPFDARRAGIVNGEGSAQIVLESREHAERRGARVMASVLGAASRSESVAGAAAPPAGAIRRAIRAALAAAELEPTAVGHVNAHGLSTIDDDRAEAMAIREELGDVPVTAPKSFFGHLGPGGGMVELAVSLIALAQGVIPQTLNYQALDPECPVKVVAEPRPTQNGSFVALNHNASGSAAAVVIQSA
jgi:3-oxoacyl-[acyl-carrier-protein] synthase II